MHLIYPTKDYEKSYSKLFRSGNKQKVLNELECVIEILASGNKLDKKYKDHNLTGEYEGYRECHIKDDLLLIYCIQKKELILVLIDIGSHSYLFG